MLDDLDKLEVATADVEAVLDALPADTRLIDVRETWELVRGILPGAIHMPLSRFEDFVPLFQSDQHYIIYCEHGVRSLDVAAWLQANKQIDARSMRGGFAEWRGAVATSDTKPDNP